MIDLGRPRCVHLIGIGGAGMCGIAEILLNQGHRITGSEISASANTARLEEMGARIYYSHHPSQVGDADVVVVSSAIPDDNVEIHAALAKAIPVIPRAKALAELMRFRYGIAVSGTHGKTTTTSLISSLLSDSGHDPTFVIGGRLNHPKSHARLGKSRYIVAEADESDKSFLYLKPIIAVLTNIDRDHLGTYQHDYEALIQTFIEFMQQVPFFGLAVICHDDPDALSVASHLSCPVLTYGFSKDADVQALDYQCVDGQSHFQLSFREKNWPMVLNMPGRHNVLNTLASIAVADALDISVSAMQNSLKQFGGVARRFQYYGVIDVSQGQAYLIDDYGHHPTELQTNMVTVRELWPKRRLVLVFQPHRYSRTRDLWQTFIDVLAQVDLLILLDIYPAGEDPIADVSSHELRDVMQTIMPDRVHHVSGSSQVEQIHHHLRADDVVLMQGAGTVGLLAQQLYTHAGHRESTSMVS